MLPLAARREASKGMDSPTYTHRPDPTLTEHNRIAQVLTRRIGGYFERLGWLTQDVESSYFAGDAVEAGPMAPLLCS